ncbi:MAG: hypothetical protein ACM3NQ_24050 [Bacteroidales bacterium]
MAKKTGGARSRRQGSASGSGLVRQPGERPRKSSARARRSARQAGAPLGRAGELVRGKVGGRGLLAEARDMAQRAGKTTMHTARGIASGARGAAVSVANRTQETASQVAEKVRDNRWPALLIGAGATWLAIDAARDRFGSDEPKGRGEGRRRSSRRQERSMASDAVSSIADAGRDLGERVGQFVRDNPVLAGATTLGLGMAVGMALPQTSAETAVLGDARQQAVRKVKEAAEGTLRNVRGVAESMQKLAGRD